MTKLWGQVEDFENELYFTHIYLSPAPPSKGGKMQACTSNRNTYGSNSYGERAVLCLLSAGE